MPPEVTAVITTHARPASVSEALASVLAETHKDLEIVIVDDGSTFVAPPVIGVPLRVVRGSHLGVARARNLGLAEARGEFIIYLDDDDIALPKRIASLLFAAKQNRAALCFGMTRRVVDDGAPFLLDVPTNHISPGPVGFCDLLTCAPHANAVLAATETLRAIGGFDEGADHFDDWSAWLRIADRDIVVWRIAETVAEWRVHSLGLSARVLHGRTMKQRIRALFERLQGSLSEGNARAVAKARQVLAGTDVITYDDYVDAVATMRETLHANRVTSNNSACALSGGSRATR
jgi:glycosyltransferase involved in cell wall biosynthesis